MSKAAQELGRQAEDMAAEYLVSLGWKVLARNVRNEYGELDIIAMDPDASPEELVIVEVRARTIGKMQGPVDSVGYRKLRALIRASQWYVETLEWSGFWRIDLVAITVNDKKAPGEWELEHLKDITAGRNIAY